MSYNKNNILILRMDIGSDLYAVWQAVLGKRVIHMDALEKEALYTVEDIYRLPEGERAELIDGQIYYMASPGTGHQRLVMNLSYQIQDFIHKNHGECEVFPAPFAVFLNQDNRNYLEPDITVVCDREKLTQRGCNGAPDWVVEIVSPSSRDMDYYRKLFKYRAADVREYWIVDQEKDRVTVYRFEREEGGEYSLGEEIPVGIFEGLTLRVM